MDDNWKNHLLVLIANIDGIMIGHTDWYFEDAVDAVKRHWSSWTYGASDIWFCQVFNLPEYNALEEKYKDRLKRFE